MRGLSVFMMAVLLSGCANQYLPYPRSLAMPGVEQEKLRAAGHWDLLAQRESQRVLETFQTGPSVYVDDSKAGNSPFESAYHHMLVSHLVGAGAQVMVEPRSDAYRMEYEIQTVTHDRDRWLRMRPGLATGTVAAAAIIRDISNHWSQPELMVVPIAIGFDLWLSMKRNTRADITEVIINTRMHDGNRIVHADTSVYYFDAQDMHNFRQPRSFGVVGMAGE